MVFVTGVFFLFLFFSFMRTCALFFLKAQTTMKTEEKKKQTQR